MCERCGHESEGLFCQACEYTLRKQAEHFESNKGLFTLYSKYHNYTWKKVEYIDEERFVICKCNAWTQRTQSLANCINNWLNGRTPCYSCFLITYHKPGNEYYIGNLLV